MPIVIVDDQQLQFPDDMSDGEIAAVLRQKFPPKASAASRFGKGLAIGAKERVLGGLQLGLEALGQSGSGVHADTQELAARYAKERKAGGTAGEVGAFLGDPLTAMPVGVVGAAGKLGAKALAKIGAATGAAYGGLDPMQAGQDRLNNTAVSAATGAVLAPTIGAVLPGAVRATTRGVANAVRGVTARGKDDLAATGKALQDKASDTFTRFRNEGLVFSLPRTAKIAREVLGAVNGGMSAPTKKLYTDTMGVARDFERNLLTGGRIGLDNLYGWRKAFAASARQSKRAGREEDARVATLALNRIDNLIDETAPIDVIGGKTDAVGLLNQGKAEWSRYRKFEDIADLVGDAAGNPDKLRKSAARVLERGKGYTTQERALLEEMAASGLPDKALATLSRVGVGPSWSQAIGASTGAGAAVVAGGVPAGVGLVAAGTLAKLIRSSVRKGEAESLLRLIEAGGKVPEKKVMTLPPKLAKMLLQSDLVMRGAIEGAY